MKIEAYSDGSATTSEKPGGWGAVVLVDGALYKKFSGHLEYATNNDAELIAAIKSLECAHEFLVSQQSSFPLEFEVILVSDSEIVLNWANGKYRFKQQEKIHLYDQLRTLVQKMNVKTKWVRGHGTDTYNILCDRLANQARLDIKDIDKIPNTVDTRIGSKKIGVVSLWYQGILRLVDFEQGIVETYNRDAHGKRGSVIEIRESKDR